MFGTEAPSPAPAAPPRLTAEQANQLVPPALRRDLDRREQKYLGRTYVILKNPLSLGYFRLPVDQAVAADLFDGKTGVATMVKRLRETSRYWRALPSGDAAVELASLANQLAGAGLLRVRASSATGRSRKLRETLSKRRFEMGVSKALFFRKSLFDPDRLLSRWMPCVSWIYSPWVLGGAVIFMLSSLFLAISHSAEIAHQGADFFTLENLGLTWVLFLGVKVIHEFGHGFTAKRHGAEVHEMGFMFILFTPYLYCNVSDSWLAGRRARIAVTSAGILVELFIAAMATWLWWFSQPGLFHQICFNTMVLCSVSTVIFNANPLMKFDGYYIMTDLLEVPNLRAKSNAWVTALAQRTLLGIKSAGRMLASHETGPWFGVYAVAAYAYGWFIMYRISIYMFDVLKPFGLQFLSRTYVGLFLFVSLALPLYRLGRSLKGNPEFQSSGMPRLRFLILGIGLVLAIFFVVPWNESISRRAALEQSRVYAVSAPLDGFLRKLEVREGQLVSKGEVLGQVENRMVESRLKEAHLQREATLVRYRAALMDSSPEARLSVPALQKSSAAAGEQISALDKKISELTLRSPVDGVVRTAGLSSLIGTHFPARRRILEVGSRDMNRIIIPLTEKQARRVEVGQRVTVRFDADPSLRIEGRILKPPVAPTDHLRIAPLANIHGGDVPAQLDPGSGEVRPSTSHYEVEATVDLPESLSERLRPHSLAHVRIQIQSTTLGLWLWERVVDMVDPGIRL